MTETWKAVQGYEGLYEVSNQGRLRRIEHKYLSPCNDSAGYRRAMLYDAAHQEKQHSIHRLVAAAFIGPCPDGYQVNHKDGQRSNNRIENLEYLTAKENHAHSWQVLGRQAPHHGTQTHFAKLTDNDVIRIRQMRADGLKYAEIAQHFNTKQANVWHICVGRTWKHLLAQPPVPV